MDVKFIHNLENRLSDDLPGELAHIKMSPLVSDKYRLVSPDHKIACVLILIYPKNEKWHLSLIERASIHPEDKHAGQISFPGGQLDDNDESYEHCALRETYEEIGVSPDSIGILGSLSPIFVYVSNFLVHPFVGFTTEHPKFIRQTTEVNQIIEVQLDHFINPKNKGLIDMPVRDVILKETPFYNVNGHKLWGASAMMMSEFEHILMDILD